MLGSVTGLFCRVKGSSASRAGRTASRIWRLGPARNGRGCWQVLPHTWADGNPTGRLAVSTSPPSVRVGCAGRYSAGPQAHRASAAASGCSRLPINREPVLVKRTRKGQLDGNLVALPVRGRSRADSIDACRPKRSQTSSRRLWRSLPSSASMRQRSQALPVSRSASGRTNERVS